jgi:hypothetical protein
MSRIAVSGVGDIGLDAVVGSIAEIDSKELS